MLLLLLLIMLALIAGFVVFSRHLVVGVIGLSVFSFLMSLLYLVMDAPDVAITEASVGGAVSAIFMLWALLAVKVRKVKDFKRSYLPVFVVLLTFASLLYVMPYLPHFGDPDAPIHKNVAPYYIENTDALMGIPNLVTAILASFRGYDTFCETTVVLIAALAVSLILRQEKYLNKRPNETAKEVIDV